jgi:hypothetical protein
MARSKGRFLVPESPNAEFQRLCRVHGVGPKLIEKILSDLYPNSLQPLIPIFTLNDYFRRNRQIVPNVFVAPLLLAVLNIVAQSQGRRVPYSLAEVWPTRLSAPEGNMADVGAAVKAYQLRIKKSRRVA